MGKQSRRTVRRRGTVGQGPPPGAPGGPLPDGAAYAPYAVEEEPITLWSVVVVLFSILLFTGAIYYYAFAYDDGILQEGTRALEEDRLEDAVILLQRGRETRVSDLERLHNNLAIAYHRRDDVDAAMQHWRAALSVNPESQNWFSVVARFNLANSLRSSGHVAEPLRHYLAITALNASCAAVATGADPERAFLAARAEIDRIATFAFDDFSTGVDADFAPVDVAPVPPNLAAPSVAAPNALAVPATDADPGPALGPLGRSSSQNGSSSPWESPAAAAAAAAFRAPLTSATGTAVPPTQALCSATEANWGEFSSIVGQSSLFAGILFRELGMVADAEERLKAALVGDTSVVDGLYQLGSLSMEQGRAKTATHYMRRCTRIPKVVALLSACYAALGALSEVQGDLAKAADHYRASLNIKPNYVVATGRLHHLGYVPPRNEEQLAGDQLNFAGPMPLRSTGLVDALFRAFDRATGPVGSLPIPWFDILEVGCELGVGGRGFHAVANTLVGTYTAYGQRNAAKGSPYYTAINNEDPIFAVQQRGDTEYDVILAPYVLQQFIRLERWMGQAARVLRPGGVLVAAFIAPYRPSTNSPHASFLRHDILAFSHSRNHIEGAANTAGLVVRHFETQAGSVDLPLVGGAKAEKAYIYAFEKPMQRQ